jgi:nickel-dependent lactate racemase
MKLSLKYGEGSIGFDIPKKALSGPVIRPRKEVKQEYKGKSLEEIIEGAILNPFNRDKLPKLVENKVVGLVVSDEWRAGLHQKIIEGMLKGISKGKPREVRLFCACGTHDPKVYSKNIRVWADQAAEDLKIPNYSFYANDCDRSEFIYLGNTKRDTKVWIEKPWMETEVRLYGHEAKFHYMAGYSCVDKQVIPGLAKRITVEMNHKHSLDHKHSVRGMNAWHPDPKRRNNPFNLDAKDARKLTESCILKNGKLVKEKPRTFSLDMISDPTNIYWIESGDPDLVSTHVIQAVDKQSMFRVKKQKYVIVSPGGPPASQALYGTQNCFDMALKGGILDGGEALITAPLDGRPDLPEEVRGIAPDIKSKRLFYDSLVRMSDWPLERATKFIDENFELYLWKTDRVLKLLKENRIKLYFYCELKAEKLERAGLSKAESLQGWIDERIERSDGLFTVIDDGNKIAVLGEDEGA